MSASIAQQTENPDNLAGYGATDQLKNHHEVAKRPVRGGNGHRVVIVAEEMLRRKTIEVDEYLATERWYGDYSLGVFGVLDDAGEIDKSVRVSKSSYSGICDSQLDAFTRYKAACEAVGKTGKDILHAAVAECVTLKNLGEMFHWPVNHAPTAVGLIFKLLAEHYERVDSARPGLRRLDS